MSLDIKCPNCSHEFALNDAMIKEMNSKLSEEKEKLRSDMLNYKKQKEDEFLRLQTDFTKREQELQQKAQQQELVYDKKLSEEKKRLQQSLEETLRKSIASDYENQLSLLQSTNKETEEKLKEARHKELEFLKLQQDLQNREAELELNVQKHLQEERIKLVNEIRKVEEQKIAAKETDYQMRVKELEKQLEDQKLLAEEMRRKAEQGSTQLQGEVQELALEEMLKTTFPFDLVEEVGKGFRGADCIQTVRNGFGQECGKIIYESKRTENFGADWIEKLKKDMRSQSADVAILVTKTMPRDMNQFGEKEGVWICSFAEVKALVHILRDGIIKIAGAAKAQENKGEKMHMLYDYLTSNEFAGQWKAIFEGFASLKNSIQTERIAMEKLWKMREKQLEKVLLNSVHIQGSIIGIAGQDSIQWNLLDSGETPAELENEE